MSYYGLIPEKVTAFTSATFDKKKKKRYDNQFGSFLYRDVPANVYPLGINVIEEGEYNYQIATPEKALCDKLYTLNPLKNMQGLAHVLFNDLRIDLDEFSRLNVNDLEILSNYYHCTNVDLLYRYMRRNLDE